MNRIKEVLDTQDKTEKWLADVLLHDIKVIHDWCDNKVDPSIKTLFAISMILEVDVGDIYISKYQKN